MRPENIILTLDIYNEHLKTINGIDFTPREIDIISCILNRRGTSISAFLSIGTRAVETHSRNIRQKAGGLSGRENIIDFIEKSGKLSLIKNEYYLSLRIRVLFEQLLGKISKELNLETVTCLLVHENKQQYKASLIPSLKEHLKRVSFKIETLVSEGYSFLTQPHNEPHFQKLDHIIYLLPEGSELPQLTTMDFKNLEKTIVLFQGKNPNENHDQSLRAFTHVNILENKNYYSSFFQLIKKMFPNKNMDKIIEDFTKQYQEIYSQYGAANSQASPQDLPLDLPSSLKKKFFYLFFNFPEKKIRIFAFVSLLTIIPLFTHFFFFKGNHVGNLVKTDLNSIRSDFILPKDAFFLNRKELIKQIDSKFKGNNENIKTVALVGTGGAGKTTLARQYGQEQKADIVWELNAETIESLKKAFDNLAQSVANTEERQKILRELQDIKNSDEKDKKILQFVKDHLRAHSNWFLIYDNVEEFADIQKYFPQDVTAWGQGKALVTTRDLNIQNNKYVDSIIPVGELNPDQKISLFNKITNGDMVNTLTSYQIEETKKFLEKIPPFPLDISTAAHYLKATRTSYKNYLENLRESDNNFSDVQENLLKESGDYLKTRYRIITLSLNHVLRAHKDFSHLLLFLSLLDSQNIPRNLLEKMKSSSVIDNFIYHLNKHSLITQNSYPIATFSIHRSTQAIMLAYLIKVLSLKENKKSMNFPTSALEAYIYEAVDNEDYSEMRASVPHARVFLSHESLLDDVTRSSISGVLGCAYAHLGNYTESSQLLNEGVNNLKKYGRAYYIKVAQFLAYLGTVYLMLGNYEKASDSFEQSYTILQKSPSEDNVTAARILANLGNVYREMGDYIKALNLMEKSLLIYKKILPENHHKIGAVFVMMGNVYRAFGNYKKSVNLLEKGLAIWKLHFPKNHTGIAWISLHLGMTHIELGNYDKARDYLEQSLLIFKAQFHENHIWIKWTLTQLGIVYSKGEKYEEGLKLLETSLIDFRKTYDEDHIETARVLMYLGQIYLLKGKIDVAQTCLTKASKIFEKNKHPDLHMALEALAELHVKIGLHGKKKRSLEQTRALKNQAIHYLNQALQIVKVAFPKDCPHSIRIQGKLKNFGILPLPSHPTLKYSR